MNGPRFNIVTATDSYKWSHPDMIRKGVEQNYAYFEHRGGPYDRTVWFGLQAIIARYLEGRVVTESMVEEAEIIHRNHMPKNTKFHREGWDYILREHNGYLPLEIRSRREGTVHLVGTVLMTYTNTDPKVAWLVGHVESLLMHVWYPATVATVGFHLRQDFRNFVGSWPGVDYMLHDFGFRGVSVPEAGRMGGMAHLVSFKGTDTIEGMRQAQWYYNASLVNLAHSVPATEHSIMTTGGRYGDIEMLEELINQHAGGLLSVVTDSYDYQKFVRAAIKLRNLLEQTSTRLVIRPDSMTEELHTPSEVLVWTLKEFEQAGLYTWDENLRLLDRCYGLLWGDGLDADEIVHILQDVVHAGFSAKNLVFGMGGGR